jgi:hypothetical protein
MVWSDCTMPYKGNDPAAGTPMLSAVIERDPALDKRSDTSGPRIRCPHCGWSPREDDLWSCTCGHEWNTFDTGGGSVGERQSGNELSLACR